MINKLPKINFDRDILFSIIVSISVVTVLVIGFMMFVNPFEERLKRIDYKVASKIVEFHQKVKDEYTTSKNLEKSIEKVRENYDFDVQNILSKTYEICADFKRDNTSDKDNYRSQEILHKSGYYCIELNIDNYYYSYNY